MWKVKLPGSLKTQGEESFLNNNNEHSRKEKDRNNWVNFFPKIPKSPHLLLSSSETLFFQYLFSLGHHQFLLFHCILPSEDSKHSLMPPIFKIKQRKYSDLSLQTSPTLFLFPETIVYNMFCLHFLLPTLLPLLCICPRPLKLLLSGSLKPSCFQIKIQAFFFFFQQSNEQHSPSWVTPCFFKHAIYLFVDS